jgi:pyruvate formate lyase activating enzyme
MVEEDFFSFLSKRQGLLDGVAITGGEPLMRPGIDLFIQKIRDLGFLIKLDTNGYHPQALQQLIAGGLVDYVAMDIKNSLPKYGLTVGVPQVDTGRIQQSVDIIMNSSIDYEFRTTVVKELHEEKDFELIGQWIKGAKAYYLQQFTPRDTVPDKTLTSPSADEMELFLKAVLPNVSTAAIRGI